MTTERLELRYGLVAEIVSAESDRAAYAPKANYEEERCVLTGQPESVCGCSIHQRQREAAKKKKG